MRVLYLCAICHVGTGLYRGGGPGPKKNSNWLKTAWRLLASPTYCVFANPLFRFFCVSAFYDHDVNIKSARTKNNRKNN